MNQLSTTRGFFGKTSDGNDVHVYTLSNQNGLLIKITEFGGIITAIKIPGQNRMVDVVLGFNHLRKYMDDHPYFGAIIGRYANRIAGARFSLDGREYHLAANNGSNHLHGGRKGFDKVVWKSSVIENTHQVGIKLFYLSEDREEGYPGNLRVWVEYRLNNKNELVADFRAESDRKTPVNITNHSYFNLNGEGSGDILNHRLTLYADYFTPVDQQLIPSGDIHPVKGTPLDFTDPVVIGNQIKRMDGGYDHNFVLRKTGSTPEMAAELEGDRTGFRLQIFTTQPGIQFYSGNFLDGSLTGKSMKKYRKHFGLCLEPQHFPDSPHHPSFPPAMVSPGETYHHRVIYRFLF